MSTKTTAIDTSWVTESPDRPPVPAEVVFLLVVLVLTVFFTLAGIPGEALPVAGEGSEALKRDWLAERQVQVDGQAVVVPPSETATPAETAPTDDR
jgi:hypothetical protein